MSLAWKKEDGDLVFSSAGRLVRIGNEEKLAQEIGDALLTNYDASRGIGSELREFQEKMTSPGVAPVFGDAFLAQVIEDTVTRYSLLQSRDPKTVPAERIDTSKTQIDIRHPNKKTFVFFLNVYSQTGKPVTANYRVRLRHQYPNRDARTVFPAGIVTDDSVP